MRHRAPSDDLLLDEVNHDEILVGSVEEWQQGEGEARSDGEKLPNLLVDVRRAYLVAACAISGDDVGIACKEMKFNGCQKICTEPIKSLGTWLRAISSCSCLTVLPGPAWVLLSKICKDIFPQLCTCMLQEH